MAFSNYTLWTVSIVHSTCLSLSITPLLCYHLYKFNKRRNEMFVRKRYPNVVYIITVLIMMAIIINSYLQSIKQISPLELSNALAFSILSRANNAITSILGYGIQGMFLCRFWLMFYDLNHANSNMNKKWKSYLDKTLVEGDFWLKHKATFGSLSYAFTASCIVTIICSTICIVYFQIMYPPQSMMYVTATLHVLFIVTWFTLYCKSPHILDLLYMRYELKLLLIVTISGVLVALAFTPAFNSDNELISLIGKAVRMDSALIGYAVYALTSTWFILRKLDNKYHEGYAKQLQRETSIELQRVLLDPSNLELFVQHLAREFCIEVIVSFIEMVQFKHLIDSKFGINLLSPMNTISEDRASYTLEEKEERKLDVETEIFFNYDECDITKNSAIPKSSMVYKSDHEQSNTNDLTPFLKIAHKIYKKYIKIGAELEVNISGEARDIFINDMEGDVDTFIDKMINAKSSMEAIDLFEYFDCIIEEMYILLASSCDRFLETDKNINIARIHLVRFNTNQIEHTLKHTNNN